MRLLVALCAFTALGAAACGDDGVPKPARMLPVTEAEATAFAAQFVAAASPCEPARLGPLFDSRNLGRRAINKTRLRPDMKRELVKELERRRFDVSTQLCQGLADDVRFDLLRVRQVGADHHPLLRMIGGGTFNYYDLELGKPTAEGEPRAVDMLDYYSGNLLSDTVAEGMGVGASAAMRGERFDPAELTAARAAGDWQKVRDLVASMPPTLRAARIFRLAELQAVMQLEDPAYVDLLTAFERDFPDDPSMLLLVIDGHVMRKDVHALIAAIDRLERKLGGDPYLDLHRAGAYTLDPTPANLSEGELLARAVTTKLPELQDGWWTLATIQLMRGDHAGVVPTLDELKRRFAIVFDRDAMAAEAIYAGFLASPEFTAWWATSR
ncbi:MAG: hypothetical protein K8M05_21100 [Deltaproteobacteria bacterium]|nr:hypothetical protein [Kofleriaceae bacterium]